MSESAPSASDEPTRPVPPGTREGWGAPSDTGTGGAGEELSPDQMARLKLAIPGYDLLNELGSGGQATVYRAREQTSGLTVAIKLLHSGPFADATSRERLRRETLALRALNHPNIVTVIESGTTPAGLDYLVMNYVDGRPLDALWRDRRFAARVAPEPQDRLRLFKRVCDVVQAAHRKGITHRDLSPSNILIDQEGHPHVLDFGLATTAFDAAMSPSGSAMTMTGAFLGKVKYAAPEQAKGSPGRTRTAAGIAPDPVDIRTDVYALGVILYQILTGGSFPYEVVGNLVDVLNNIIHSPPLPPSAALAARSHSGLETSVAPGLTSDLLSADLVDEDGTRPRPTPRVVATPSPRKPALINSTIEAVVLKALEKRPELRYQSAGELALDVENYLAGRPTIAREPDAHAATSVPGQAPTALQPDRRRRRLAWLGRAAWCLAGSVAAIVLALAFGLIRVPGSDAVNVVVRPRSALAHASHWTDRIAGVHGGRWSVEGDEVAQSWQRPHRSALVFGSPEWSFYDFTLSVRSDGGPEGFRIMFHFEGWPNHCEVAIGAPGSSHALRSVYQHDADGISPWFAILRFEQHRWYRVRLEVRGARARLFLDDALVFDRVDERLVKGRIGIATLNSTATFKDFLVRSPLGNTLWEGPPEIP